MCAALRCGVLNQNRFGAAKNSWLLLSIAGITPGMSNRVGVIGGSGLYHIEGFTGQEWVKVKTPFGRTSDDFMTGRLEIARSYSCPVMVVVTAFCPANSTIEPISGR